MSGPHAPAPAEVPGDGWMAPPPIVVKFVRWAGWITLAIGLASLLLFWRMIVSDSRHGGLMVGVPAAFLLVQGVLTLAGAAYARRSFRGGWIALALGLVLLPLLSMLAPEPAARTMMMVAGLLGWPVWQAMR